MQRELALDGASVCHLGDILAAVAAAILALILLIPDARAQQQQAGVSAAVRGRVELASAPGQVGRLIKSGEPIYLGNAIKSGPDSGLQILLLDQTTFTIGPDSELTIDQFVYDPSTGAGKVSASVAKGVFRFVTGKVAQTNPSDMQVKLPSGTIGIRGTIAMGSATPGSEQVVLVGPGKDLEGNNRPGGLLLTSNPTRGTADTGSRPQLALAKDQFGFSIAPHQVAQGGPAGGSQVTIDRPGFGSIMGPQGWGGATFFTPEMLGALQTRLTYTGTGQPNGQGGQNQGQGGQASQNAGAGQTQAKNNAQGTLVALNRIDKVDNLGNDASNDQTRNFVVADNNGINGFTTIGQLTRFVTGTYHFTQNNVPISDGYYNININVDATNRMVGVADSFVELNTSTVKGKGYAFPVNYANMPSGNLATGFLDGEGDFYGTGCGSSGLCDVNVLISFKNTNGQVAGSMQHSLSVLTDQDVALFSGSGTATAATGIVADANKLADGNATFEQLRVQTAGKYYYTGGSTLSGSGGAGSYKFQSNIDFGARTFGGGNSKIDIVGGGYGGTANIAAISFATLSGTATFNPTPLYIGTGATCTAGCTADFKMTLQNMSGILAKTGTHQLNVKNQTGTVIASGSGSNATRKEGLSP